MNYHRNNNIPADRWNSPIDKHLSPLHYLHQQVIPNLDAAKVYEGQFKQLNPFTLSGRCPECNDINGFIVDRVTLRYHCNSCDISGEVMSYVNGGEFQSKMILKKLSKLIKMSSVTLDEERKTWFLENKKGKRKEWLSELKRDNSINEFFIKANQELLAQFTTENSLPEILKSNGINRGNVSNLILGYYPSGNKKLTELLLKAKVPEMDVEEWSYSIVFGIRDQFGIVQCCWLQELGETENYCIDLATGNPSSLMLTGTELITDLSTNHIYIFDNPIKAVALQASGFRNVRGIVGNEDDSVNPFWERDCWKSIECVTLIVDMEGVISRSILNAIKLWTKSKSTIELDVAFIDQEKLIESVSTQKQLYNVGDESDVATIVLDMRMNAVEFLVSMHVLGRVNICSNSNDKDKAIKESKELLAYCEDKLDQVTVNRIIDKICNTTGTKKKAYQSDLEKYKRKLGFTTTTSPSHRSQSSWLILEPMFENAEYFKTQANELFISMEIEGIFKVVEIDKRNSQLEQLLSDEYFKRTNSYATPNTIRKVIGRLTGKAINTTKTVEAHSRIAWLEDKIYLDLHDVNGKWVEISANGWVIRNDRCPILFRYPPGMKPLPEPVNGGKIDQLKQFINCQDPTDFVLIIGWLVGVFSQGSYAHLVLLGQAGSAKSTMMKILAGLIDPSVKISMQISSKTSDISLSLALSEILCK